MKQLGVFLVHLDGMLVLGKVVSPAFNFAVARLDTWVVRGTVRVNCLAQEHNTMTLPRARTQTVRSEDEHTNHGANAPPPRAKGDLGILTKNALFNFSRGKILSFWNDVMVVALNYKINCQ